MDRRTLIFADWQTLACGAMAWNRQTVTVCHTRLPVDTDLPRHLTHIHSPRERLFNENPNGLIGAQLPSGIERSSFRPYLDLIADEPSSGPFRRRSRHTNDRLWGDRSIPCEFQ